MKKCEKPQDASDQLTTTTATTGRTDSGYVSSGLVTDVATVIDYEDDGVDEDRSDSGLCVTTVTSGCFSSMDDVQIERFAMLNVAGDESSTSETTTTTTSTGSEPPPSAFRYHRLCDEAFHPDRDGDTYLHLAIVHGRWDIISRLVQLSPHPSFLDFQNNLLQSPLHLAVLMDLPKTVRCLVLSGAALDVRNRIGNTPLHVACELGRVECVRELLRPIAGDESTACDGTTPSSPRPLEQDLEIRNYEGQMCVHVAALGHHLEVLGLLRSHGADMNAREGKSGRTALCLAIESRRWPLVSYLVGECRASVDEPTYAGLTPFQLAHAADPLLAAALLRLGARPSHPVISDNEDTTDDDSDYGSIADESMDTDVVVAPAAAVAVKYSDLKINGEPLW